MFKLITLALVLASSTALAGSPKPPKIVSQHVDHDDQCSDDDPLGPCYVRTVAIYVPERRAVDVELDCGEQFVSVKPMHALLGPGTTKVEIVATDFVGVPECKISKWQYQR